ncbi:MAG: hypothetical protein WCO56_15180 [Verrucomicrobiota bacterium]
MSIVILICLASVGCIHQRVQTVLLNPQTDPYVFHLKLFKTKDIKALSPALQIIANDDRFPVINRRITIMQLLKQNYHPGMTLDELAHLFDHPKWLNDSDIYDLPPMAGTVPICPYPGESAFRMELLPKDGKEAVMLWYRLSGFVTRDDFSKSVRQGKAAPAVPGIQVLSIGSSEPCVKDWRLWNAFGTDPDGIAGQLKY